MVPTVPKEFGNTEYYNNPEKLKVPAGGPNLKLWQNPSSGAKLSWYNLKEDQLVVTKATAFPYGFDRFASTPQECPDGENEILKKMNEFVVDAVIADENGNRYVNVLELVAVRKDDSRYVIKGRIERSSWRDKDDGWVNILMVAYDARVKRWEDTEKFHWSADPVEVEVAQGSAGYQSKIAPQDSAQEKPTKTPPGSFEDWREAFMVQWKAGAQEADAKWHEKMGAMIEQGQKDRSSGTFTIFEHHQNHPLIKIADGKFRPESSGQKSFEDWTKNGDRLTGPNNVRWNISGGSISREGNPGIRWNISENEIKKDGAMDRFVLKGNEVEAQAHSGNTMSKVGEKLIIESDTDTMDTKTLAFALVALGAITDD